MGNIPLDQDDLPEFFLVVDLTLDLLELYGVFNNNEARPGILEDICGLFRGVGMVYGNIHTARKQGAQISYDPLHSIEREYGEPLAGLHTQCDEAA